MPPGSRGCAGSHPDAGLKLLAEEGGGGYFELRGTDDLTSTFHPYLTLSEGIKLAAQAFSKDVNMLSCCAA